jgi:hypothetical protein
MTIVAYSHKSLNKSSPTFGSYILQVLNIDALSVIENSLVSNIQQSRMHGFQKKGSGGMHTTCVETA